MKTFSLFSMMLVLALVLFGNCKKKTSSSSATSTPPVTSTPTPTTSPTNTKLPTIATLTVSGITDSSAVCSGTVSSEGASVITAVGICWDEQPSPTLLKSKTIEGAGVGSFTSKATGLKANTTYYVRAYASNLEGTAYGNELSFKTNKNPNWTTWNNGVPFIGFIKAFTSINTNLYVGTSTGVLKSENGVNNWTQMNNGLSSLSITSLISKNGVLFASTQYGGVFVSNDGGNNWTASNFGISDLTVNGMTLVGEDLVVATSGAVYKSTNNGSTWFDITPSVQNIMPTKVTSLNGTIYIYDASVGKCMSLPPGASDWNTMPNLPASAIVLGMRGIDNVLFVMTGSGLYKTENDGVNWTKLSNGVGNEMTFGITKSNGVLYLGTTKGIFSSSNNGASWTLLGLGLSWGSYEAVHVHNGGIYTGSANTNPGIYYLGL